MEIYKGIKEETLKQLYFLPKEYINKILSNYNREFPKLILKMCPDNFIEQVQLLELKPLIKKILEHVVNSN